jgi:hypothetical protein
VIRNTIQLRHNVYVFAAVNRSLSQHYAEYTALIFRRHRYVRDPRNATQHTAGTNVYT